MDRPIPEFPPRGRPPRNMGPRPIGPDPRSGPPRYPPEDAPPGGPPFGAPDAPPYPPRQPIGPETDFREDVVDERRVPVFEEELVPRRHVEQIGEVEIHKTVESVPARLEVDTFREDVEIQRVPVGQVVEQRVAPWEENGTLVIPVYEEELITTKQLVLREHVRVRRRTEPTKAVVEESVRREHVDVEHHPLVDPAQSPDQTPAQGVASPVPGAGAPGVERFERPVAADDSEITIRDRTESPADAGTEHEGLLERIVKRAVS